MDGLQEPHRAANDVLFRQINEHHQAGETEDHIDPPTYVFLCECSDPSCSARIQATLAEYQHLRRRGDGSIVESGHLIPQGEPRRRRFKGWPRSQRP